MWVRVSSAPPGFLLSRAEAPRLAPWAAFFRRFAAENLSEHVFHLAEQRAHERLVIDLREVVELLQQFFLTLAEFGRHLNSNLDVQISLPVSVQHRHAFVANAEGGPGLRAVGNFQHVLAVHRGHANLRAHRRLSHRDRHHAVQVIAFAREEGMLFHVQDDIQISGRAAKLADLSRSRKTDSRSILDARGHFRVDGSLAQNPAFALALRARIGDDAPRALAGRTGTSNAEKSLLITNLTAPAARTASGWPLARRRTGTVALLASLVAAHRNPRLRAEERFLKLQRQVFPEISAALHPAASASSAATTEHVAEAEKFSEDIAEVLKHRGIKARALPRTAAQSCVAIAVINGALVRVGEHGVGFADFLEFVFRVRIIGIAVRMKLQRQLAVGALELLLRDRAGHAQHFVVVAFCVRRQNKPFFKKRNQGKLGPDNEASCAILTLQGFFATLTIAGRSKRSLNL